MANLNENVIVRVMQANHGLFSCLLLWPLFWNLRHMNNGKIGYLVWGNQFLWCTLMIVYHKLVEDRAWLANKVLDTWYIIQHVK